MTFRHSKSILLPLAVGLVQILSGCMAATVNDPDSGKSAGGSDEIDTRIAVDRAGRPVASARIALVRPNDSTGKPVAVSATGADGSFPNFVVPDGFYSVVLRDTGESMGKYLDSVAVKSQKLPSGRDTLLALGSVRGVVRVATGHSPTGVSIGLVGTDIRAIVNADGTFRVELVPGGLYTLGAFTTMEGYGTFYKRIQLKDGQNLTLPDTLVMPFTGLPSPGGLRVLQDTGTGNVRVSWNRIDHPDLLGYVLERVESGSVTTSRYLTDTAWTDSLGASWEAMPLLGPWPSRDMAYRVRARSLGGSPDSKSAAQAITANAPEWTKSVVVPEPKLVQDSFTGNVHLAWPEVRHPKLKGYVVERIVGGKVVTSSILQDTLYLDSLERHWDSLPLSGPWPDLQVSYRIGAVAKDTARGTVASLQGHAPAWVKSVDSTRMVVTQDTSTGNVRIGWSPVKHPHLVGYALDRIENGIVRSGPTVVDTNYIDSLGAYWTALPLLGPWPKRRISYRVRLIADEVGTDGLSSTVAFDAQPPTWTKHVDSVKVTMATDTVTGVTTLKWNTPNHPDLTGWNISRVSGGFPDCMDSTKTGEWSELGCPDLRPETIDSTGAKKNSVRLVREKAGRFDYTLKSLRRLGSSESQGQLSREQMPKTTVVWRDSTIEESDVYADFKAFGGWLLKQQLSSLATNSSWLTRDGVNWEQIPHKMDRDAATGVGDSVWTGALEPDSLHFRLHARKGVGNWSDRIVTLPTKAHAIKHMTVLDGKVVLGIVAAGDNSWNSSIRMIVDDSTFENAKIGGIGPEISSMQSYRGIPVSDHLRLDEIFDPSGRVLSLMESGKVVVSKSLSAYDQHFHMGFVGVTGQKGGAIASYTRANSTAVKFAYLPPIGDAIELADLSGSVPSVLVSGSGTFVFQDEIWTLIDGHLWKGKLNLPSMTKLEKP